jgi:fatty-acid desaturase
MWLITGLGLTVGYHRLFAHRAIGGLAAGSWWGALTGFLWAVSCACSWSSSRCRR